MKKRAMRIGVIVILAVILYGIVLGLASVVYDTEFENYDGARARYSISLDVISGLNHHMEEMPESLRGNAKQITAEEPQKGDLMLDVNFTIVGLWFVF